MKKFSFVASKHCSQHPRVAGSLLYALSRTLGRAGAPEGEWVKVGSGTQGMMQHASRSGAPGVREER